jgi:AcrR family transcriptional regulator
MITASGRARQPTKERLLDVGLELFAANGFKATTVGDIEAAAGLQPRRGALYRHFASKEALMHAALERHLRSVGDAEAADDQPPPGDLRAEALAVGGWLLGELDRERLIVRILEQDGDWLPELRESFRHSLVDAGYREGARLARRWLGKSASAVDIDAASVVLLGALVNYRRSTWTFGATPLEVDDARFLATWADLCWVSVEALRARRTRRARHT